jgi:predicted nucleic acid-binding protein
MGKRRDGDLFIASLTIAEIRRGILEKPRGKKRDALAMAIRPQVAAL